MKKGGEPNRGEFNSLQISRRFLRTAELKEPEALFAFKLFFHVVGGEYLFHRAVNV